MTQEDKQFLKTVEHNKDFHDALIKNFPEKIPQYIKDAVNRGYIGFYDALMIYIAIQNPQINMRLKL